MTNIKESNFEELLVKFEPMIKKDAKKYSSFCEHYREDLEQVGKLALWDVVGKPKTAAKRIKGAMNDYVRELGHNGIKIMRVDSQKAQDIRKLKGEGKVRQEIAEQLGMFELEVYRLESINNIQYLDQSISGEDEGFTLYDTLSGVIEAGYDRVLDRMSGIENEDNELLKKLEKIYGDRKNAYIAMWIKEQYENPNHKETQKQLAERLGISESALSQRIGKIKGKSEEQEENHRILFLNLLQQGEERYDN